MDGFVNPDDKILELGCNVGRNLHALYQAGYSNLHGVDINLDAIKLLYKTYPDLRAIIHHSTIQKFLIKDEHYDCIFTLAVLMHIFDDWIFEHISRKANNVIITIENEHANYWKCKPRNYQEVFENLGWKQAHKLAGSENYQLSRKYIGRVFVK
jgi:2-polyprenyl-3-methyl-5-hydroxy-6-metoxy-1,4-benzoquinol methylase